MCGIVGYVGKRPVQDLLLAGLKKLEYRGYDSAGISVIAGDEIESVRAVGNLQNLFDAVAARERRRGRRRRGRRAHRHHRHRPHPLGHARARQRGERAPALRHQQRGPRRRQRHRGELRRAQAPPAGHGRGLHQRDRRGGHRAPRRPPLARGSLEEAVVAAFNELEGHFAFVAMRLDEPDTLVGVRKECPLVVGRGEGETFLASAIPAFLSETRRVQYIENDEIVVITRRRRALPGRRRRASTRARSRRSTGTRRPPRRAASTTFMLKEIHEQADAIADTIADRTAPGTHVDLDDVGALDENMLRGDRPDPHHRLRHRVPRRADGPLRAGGVGADPHRHRRRLGVPLPQAARRAGRPRDRHDAVGRDRRHARGDARRARGRRHRAGRDERRRLAGHARRRRRALHPRRAWRSASPRRRRSSARSR